MDPVLVSSTPQNPMAWEIAPSQQDITLKMGIFTENLIEWRLLDKEDIPAMAYVTLFEGPRFGQG